jgi:hypothetical protein
MRHLGSSIHNVKEQADRLARKSHYHARGAGFSSNDIFTTGQFNDSKIRKCASDESRHSVTLRFEVGASVTLVGNDLQFVGVDGPARVRFVIAAEALKRVAESVKDLTPQQKFKVYDRNREWFQEIARTLYERAENRSKPMKISLRDVSEL